jgi:hypothetical protein
MIKSKPQGSVAVLSEKKVIAFPVRPKGAALVGGSMTLTAHEVARWTRCESVYESNLLSAVRRGHRTKRDLNPYKQNDFKKAWHFGHFNASMPFESVEQGWLETRKKE